MYGGIAYIGFPTYHGVDPQISNLYLVYIIAGTLINFLTALLGISTIIVIVSVFSSINKLGTPGFSLRINYKELRFGSFDKIGRFIINISIPVIGVSFFLSAIGLIWIFIFDNYYNGIINIIVGFVIIVVLVILLFIDTVHIHSRMLDFKKTEMEKVLNTIQNILYTHDPDGIDYRNICDIHRFYYEIEKIHTWPYNPKTMRNLIITLLTSVIPLVLSFFGI